MTDGSLTGSTPDAPPRFLKLKNMETIAFILFVAFGLAVAISGSVGIALLFRMYGDGWEFRKDRK